jgi:hypothetical protein
MQGWAHQSCVDTHTPSDTIQPFRNPGGMFDLGWPRLGEVSALRAQRGQPGAEGFDDARPLLRSFICLEASTDKE